MAGEIHTVGLNIDASGAKRGAAAYAAAINKIAQATRDFEKMSSGLGKNMGKSGAFAAVARDLTKLNSLRVNPALAKNVQALSAALATFKGPSSRAVSNTRTLMRDLGKARINSNTTRGLSALTGAMNAYRGPSRSAAQNTKAFFSALAGARVSSGIASGLSAVSNAMSGFKTMGSGSVRNFQTFVATINSLRVPPGIAQLGGAMNALTGRFGHSQAAALRFGGSVNGIPWGRASAGAVQLTGNLRGLENAMSLSYQMGSQLRTLFGALTISGFTSSVIEATTSSQRLATVFTSLGMDVQETAAQMQFASDVANKYGIDLLEVQRNYGKFSAAASESGMNLKQSDFIFESLAANMRLFGLSATEQALAIKAVTQSLSKGSIQAEEFKNQFGDQMPAAMTVLKKVMQDLTGDMNVDPMEMMRKGMIGADTWVLIFEEMNKSFGKGFEDAAGLAIASMGRLKNSWTEFLTLVGNNGVMDAIGDVSKQLSDIIQTKEFQEFGKQIGEGLGNAIRKAGAAAAFLLTHIREVTKVIGVMLAGKAIHTVLQLGSAFGALGGAVTATAGKIGGLVSAFGKLGTGLRLVPALAGAVGLLGGAFGIAAVAAGTALALMWDETVKVGDATTTVGSMAKIAFTDFGNWATWAGGQVVNMFTTMAGIAGQWFEAMNQSVTGNTATWEDWAKAIIGSVMLVGQTMIDVFRSAWRLVVQNTLDAFNIITKTIQGIGSALDVVAKFNPLDTRASAEAARNAGRLFGEVQAIADNAMKETGEALVNPLINAQKNVEQYMAGIDWVSTTWDGTKESMVNYFEELARRAAEADANAPVPTNTTWEDITPPDHTGLDFLLGADEEAAALGRLGKAAKESKEALKAFAEEQAMLDAALASGKINAQQYAEALNYFKGKLEETVDPYSAMIRSMQEENNLLRLNGREQRTASEFMERKNQLLEQGVVLTDQQTQALKAMIAEQDKLKNPGPLQSWVNNMETAADAIESAGVRAMESLSDNIADMIVEGKADWASLAKQILKDLIKIGLNEVWKGMFGGSQAQQPVNAPMTGVAGQGAMGALGSAATDTIPGMASAVAQGIQMAGGGMGAGILGNDIGAGAGPFADIQNALSGKPGTGALPGGLPSGGSSAINSLTGAGYGVGGMANVSVPALSEFTTALPQASVQAASAPLTQAATAMAGATQAMNSTASAVQAGYESLNKGINDFATSAFGGGSSAPPVPVSVETIATYPTTGNGIPPSLVGAGFGAPGIANPNISDFVTNLGGGNTTAGGPHSAFTNAQGGNIRDFLAAGKANSHADGLDPEFQKRIEAMFNAPDAPPGLEIFSGHRSIERQQELWDEALRKYGSPEAARKWVAPPGRSSHNFGKAIDVGQNGSTFSGMDPEAQQWLHDNAGKYGMKFPLANEGWHMEMQETRGGAPFTGPLPGVDPMTTQGIPGMGGMSQAGVTPGMPGSMQPQMGGMMSGYGAGMMPGGGMGMGMGGMMQPMPPTLTAAGMGGGGLAGGLPGGMGMPGAAGMGGMGGGVGGGLAGLGDQVKAELTPAFQQVATTIPQQFDPAMGQVAQQLPQKFTEQGDQFGQQILSAAQPGNMQAAQDNAQKYQEANTQAANDFAMKMQQAGGGGMGGMGGMMGGGGGGGGLGGIMGIFGSFFKTGGIVGSSKPGKTLPASTWSGARSMRTGGIVGDPDAEPIIAHKGELVVPAHEVDRMRRMGMDTTLLDNAAVKSSKKSRPGAGVAQDGGEYMGVMARGAGARPIINYNISTPDANSFKASQGQIQAKAGAAAYRDAVRNN